MVRSKTRSETLGSDALYMREFRAAWKQGGFTQVNLMIHQDDREEITAMLDVMKFEKMIEGVNAGDENYINLAASRNTAGVPNLLDVESLRINLVDSGLSKEREKQAKDLLTAFTVSLRKRNLYHEASRDNRFEEKTRALAVCYSNLCSALLRYANAILKSPKQGEDYGEDTP